MDKWILILPNRSTKIDGYDKETIRVVNDGDVINVYLWLWEMIVLKIVRRDYGWLNISKWY